MGAGGGMVTAQIPVTPEDNSLVCRLNAHTPTPDQMHTAAGVYECVHEHHWMSDSSKDVCGKTGLSLRYCRVCRTKDFFLNDVHKSGDRVLTIWD